jgi:hypothetical protein
MGMATKHEIAAVKCGKPLFMCHFDMRLSFHRHTFLVSKVSPVWQNSPNLLPLTLTKERGGSGAGLGRIGENFRQYCVN